MNEPTVCAQETTGKVTAKQLLDAMRAGERHFMHGRATPGRASYSDSFVFAFSSVHKDRKSGIETTTRLDVPGWVSNGHTSAREERTAYDGRKYLKYSDTYRPLDGFVSLWNDEILRSALECLPSDAEVAFHVSLDGGTSDLHVCADVHMQYGTEHGLHCDRTYLCAKVMRRGKVKEYRFLLDSTTGGHNSARFGGGR